MDVYLFYFWGRSRRNDFGQGRRYKEGGIRKEGRGRWAFTLLSFYSFTLFILLPFRISKLLRGRCCGQACIDVLFVSPLLMCRF